MIDEEFSHYPDETLERFKEFHSQNPDVYQGFKNLAFEMKNTGRTRYSAQAIIYVLRWESDLKTTGDVFKINNDFTSIYSRLMCHHYPEFRNFFELRVMPNKGMKSPEQLIREMRK